MYWRNISAIFLLATASAAAQGMNNAGMSLMNLASGTSANPQSANMPMIMSSLGSWDTMFMGAAFIDDVQQSGSRAGDKLFSTNWFMAAAQHKLGAKATFQVDLMLSLEPATVTARRYPELFQTGETAFGIPLADAQHPHDFIMALGFHYVREVAHDTTIDFYFAPVGDPALGPVAFPHRASAAELPEAPISHHWQDSTHIADDVITAGITHKKIRLEASGFHGAEPNEDRWSIQYGGLDSWSARLWYFPSNNWAAQVSVGRLTHPEALSPGDQVRATASLAYSRPLGGSAWSSSFIWGRNHDTLTHRDLNSYLVESVLPIRKKNFITGRAELVDKDELFDNQPLIEAQLDHTYGSTFRIGAYTVGYTRDIALFSHLETGLGANVTLYSLPNPIKPYYGSRPIAANIFLRLRLRRG